MDAYEFLQNITNNNNIPIDGEDFDEEIQIVRVGITKKEVRNSKFKKKLSLIQSSITNVLTFINCTFNENEGHLSLECIGLNNGIIFFENCTFNNAVSYSNPANNKIWFRGCTFEKEVNVEGGNGHGQFLISKSNTQNSFLNDDIKFFNCSLSFLTITDTISKKSIVFTFGSIDNILIGEGKYLLIQFEEYENLKKLIIQGDTEFQENLSIKKFIAPSLSLEGSILLQNVQIDEMNLSPFNQNNGKFKIQNVKFKERLIITDSDLGRILFNEVDFSTTKISLDNSYIGECIFSNIKWPIKKRVYSYKEIIGEKIDDPLKNTLMLKEVYRQLKNVSKLQSSNIDALDFYRNEMEAYWHEIKEDKDISGWEKIIVRISKASSDFGLSLKRPFWGLIIFHLILFFFLTLCNYKGLSLNINNANWKNSWIGIGTFFYLLNPTHKFMDDENGLIQFIDFLIRLSSGFFIYNIIRATRKHSKL